MKGTTLESIGGMDAEDEEENLGPFWKMFLELFCIWLHQNTESLLTFEFHTCMQFLV